MSRLKILATAFAFSFAASVAAVPAVAAPKYGFTYINSDMWSFSVIKLHKQPTLYKNINKFFA